MEEVRRLRLEKGWNQNELAFHADLASSVISLVETGKREPNAATLRKLANALGVEIPDLFRRSESPKGPAPRPLDDQADGGRHGELDEIQVYREMQERLLVEWEEDLSRWEEKFPKGNRPQVFDYGKLVGWAWVVVRAIERYKLSARRDSGLAQRAEVTDTLGRMENVKQAVLCLLKRVSESKTDAEFREVLEANDMVAILNNADSDV